MKNVKSYQDNSGLFKKRVLDVAISEINKHTELEISYKVEKEGRAISGFRLEWSSGIKMLVAIKVMQYIVNKTSFILRVVMIG